MVVKVSEHVIQAEARWFGGLSVDLEERVPERRGRGLRPQPRSPRAPEVSQIACRSFPPKKYYYIKLNTNEIHISRRESEAGVVVDHDARNASPNLHRLVSAFRSSGHKYARTNPVPMAHQTP